MERLPVPLMTQVAKSCEMQTNICRRRLPARNAHAHCNDCVMAESESILEIAAPRVDLTYFLLFLLIWIFFFFYFCRFVFIWPTASRHSALLFSSRPQVCRSQCHSVTTDHHANPSTASTCLHPLSEGLMMSGHLPSSPVRGVWWCQVICLHPLSGGLMMSGHLNGCCQSMG